MGFYHGGQAGLEFLASSDLPALASQSAGITGMSLYSLLLNGGPVVIGGLYTRACTCHPEDLLLHPLECRAHDVGQFSTSIPKMEKSLIAQVYADGSPQIYCFAALCRAGCKFMETCVYGIQEVGGTISLEKHSSKSQKELLLPLQGKLLRGWE